MAFRLGVVAGEASGDALGERVIGALRANLEQAFNEELVVEGIGGPGMEAAGCVSLYPMETLSVMGLTEPLKRLPQLLGVRGGLVRHFRNNPPDVFLGIDSPDFNLSLERRVRQRGVPVAHLVSPSIWAWRAGRIRAIERSVDQVLHLFPFESAAYANSCVNTQYVGHPLADDLPMTLPMDTARAGLGLAGAGRVVALLPGSRASEIRAHGGLFLEAARRLLAHDPSLSFVLPVANATCETLLQPMVDQAADISLLVCRDSSITALAACNVALVASGTATLEAALVKRPMVVAYRTGALSWAVLSRLVRTPYVALPNLLHGSALVPEFLQDDATPQDLAAAVWEALEDSTEQVALQAAYTDMHQSLRQGCADQVGAALMRLRRVPA